MRQRNIRGLSLLAALILLCSLSANAFAAASEDTLTGAVTDAAAYVYRTVPTPKVGSIGGEWAVLGLARSGYEVPEDYYRNYYAAVEEHVKACKGVLHEKKYTEYSRVIVALTAMGADARNVAGYDLTLPLGDYDKTVWQGLNGPIWALLALDCGNYPMPQNEAAGTQATRQRYLDRILEHQLPDGGWSLRGGAADPDLTAMALQALAKYQDRPEVRQAIEKALACVSQMQNADGGFSSYGTDSSESVVQLIVALCELGIPLDDPRFVKNGSTLPDHLMTFCRPDGGFAHTADSAGSDPMASEQALYGLAAARRAAQGKSSLYRMDDPLSVLKGEGQAAGPGLEGKHADVSAQPVISPDKTFPDIAAHGNRPAIEALASRGIINGKGNGLFDPDAGMTRAEFSAIVVRALGLPQTAADRFTDVPDGTWYAAYVGTAYTYGIVNGTSATTFTPDGPISRQEAAVMAARAAKLCGMDTARDTAAVRDMLAQFGDYVTAADWAREGLAFCYDVGILDQSELNIQPKTPIRRCEIAQMLFNLLGSAELM